MKSFVILFLTFLVLSASAQETGRKEYPNLGINFSIPDGWVGQEINGGYMLGSQQIVGMLMILPHQTQDKAQLRQEANAGFADQEGTSLSLAGEVVDFGVDGLQAPFQGMLGWQQAKAYMISRINPLGYGVTVLAASTPEGFTPELQETAVRLAQQIELSEMVVPEVADSWSEKLKNARLTYMNSYYSSGGSYGGYSTGGGYSDQEVIDLCAQGYFRHSSSSTLSVDTGGAFGHAHDRGQGAGTWKVIGDTQGQPVLQLQFYDATVHEYTITAEGEKTFLNGKRYYRTYGTYTDDGPDCF